ncbi:MAG: hypothetical protein HYY46_10410, partial [Deltaproteobacteria bacterium]|nr:hypothetical protein [Deltaproteobacteria bacterium]
RELQTAFSAEQAKTRELAQKGDELLKAMVQGQARVQALEEIQKASEQEKGKLEAKGENVETALQELQMAYGAEQAKSREITHKADELLKAVEQAQERAERVKGRLMKAEKELKVKEEGRSGGFFQSLYKIFF